jgi:glycosyltransferase involved in cell wall biosynthesis
MRRITFLTWRDLGHPDGGGSEVYVEELAKRLAERGDEVTILCARYPGSLARETKDRVVYRRTGGRLTVYLHGLLYLLSRTGRRQDVVVDVINGLPFAAALVRRRGLVALVHHLHRDQWHIIYPGFWGQLGWFVESRVTPLLYKHVPHVTVSEASRVDLLSLGIGDVTVVRNGLSATRHEPVRSTPARIGVLSRLVPHKQIEHALSVVAALRDELDVHLVVIGSGWWADELHAAAHRLGVSDSVTFHGHVSDEKRDALLAEQWVMLLPSVKEGWGNVVLEAAAQGVPTIGYRNAGGVAESIVDGVTGVLVEDLEGMVAATRELLTDSTRREALGAAAASRAQTFSWETTAEEFTAVISPTD